MFRDAAGEFATAYGTGDRDVAAYLIRPDGYVSYRSSAPTGAKLREHLCLTILPGSASDLPIDTPKKK